MKTRLLFVFVFATLIFSGSSVGTTSYYTSSLVNYLNNASYKWCRYSTYTSYGYYCTTSDSSTYGGGSSYSRCSTDSSYLPNNAKKLLGPTDNTNGSSQTSSLSSSGYSSTLSGTSFGTSTLGWYKFTPTSSSITSINIKINSMTNANAEVYFESSTNSFIYKGSLTSGNSLDVSISYYEPVWVLVTPTSNYASVSVTGTPTVSSSSYSSSYSSSSSSDNSILVAILVPTLVGGFFFIILIVFIIVGNAIRRKRILEAQNNAIAATVFNPAPAPQLYYPPNHNPNYISASQAPSMMQPMPHSIPQMQPTYIGPPQVQQEIIVLEPVPMNQPQGPIYMGMNPQSIQPVYPQGVQPTYLQGTQQIYL